MGFISFCQIAYGRIEEGKTIKKTTCKLS